ncbi:translation initiation inhibitor [Bacillus proteolyticus]|uniref:Translation initiation inhibitor n=1 Tax=Bacillus proteolyticus TaxID=2026192 RepID=A0AA44R739_9BACI|nr:RNaseH domain-containing protein [Bacillus proteolyticus]OJE44191.1 translation initiation inhibitor [Bacillus proteolyticus]
MEKLRLLTFENIVEPLLNESVSFIYFPIEWLDIVEIHYKTFLLTSKLKRLNERLYDMFSDILFIQHNPYVLNENTPWIISKEPIRQEQLDYIFQSWYKVIHDWKPNQLLEPPKYEWHNELISNLPVLHDNETYSKWIPALISHVFCEQPVKMNDKIEEEIYFSPLRSQNICESMSEPIKDEKTQDFFAYVYRFECITRAGGNIPLLNVSVGIRRFYQEYNHPDIPLLLRRKRGMILISTSEFTLNNKKLRFVKLKVQQATNGIKWIKLFRNLKDDFHIGGEVELDHILQYPKDYIMGTNKTVLLPYNERIYKVQGTKIKSGIKVKDREYLFKEFQRKFSYFTLLPKCIKVVTNNENELFPLIAPKGLETLTLEVWSDNILMEIEQALIESEIVLAKIGEASYVLNADSPVLLKVVRFNIEKVLQNPYKMQYCQKYKTNLVDDVMKAVYATAGERNDATLALIAMENCDGREKIDPKQIVREGFARTKRISAFINLFIGQSVSRETIVNSILSLLEQKGFLKRSWNKIHLPCTYVNLSIERISKFDFLPIFSKIQGREISYKLYGNTEWQTIDCVLLNINEHNAFLPQPSKRNDMGALFKQFVSETLMGILQHAKERTEQVYFIVDADLRKYWIKELQNEKIDIDILPEIVPAMQKIPNINVIRINSAFDVPSYDVIEHDNVTDGTGLYADQKGMYYSTGEYTLNCSEILQRYILEILPLGVKSVERDYIVKMIHYMCCNSSMLLEKNLHMTYSMHMVKVIKSYITDIDAREFKEFEDELDVDIIKMEKKDSVILL